MGEERDILLAKARGRCGVSAQHPNAQKIFANVAGLPDSMQLEEFPFRVRSPASLKMKRDSFKRYGRPAFMQYLVEKHAGRLQEIGIPESSLLRIMEGRVSFGAEAEGWAVDHIKPLWLNGKNNIQNMCLIPVWLNALKCSLEDLQRQNAPEAPTIITLTPRRINGSHDQIPYIPDGYELKDVA